MFYLCPNKQQRKVIESRKNHLKLLTLSKCYRIKLAVLLLCKPSQMSEYESKIIIVDL